MTPAMGFPLEVPSDIAVFTAGNLPAHASNPDTSAVVDWPVSPSGIEFMPMSGQFIVQTSAGPVACTDGFLVITPDGSPGWSATEPA